MALRAIMLRHRIDEANRELEQLRGKDADFQTREAELEAAIAEAKTEEESSALDAAIDAFENDGLIERAQHLERLLRARLEPLAAADPRIGEVRGRGAMMAMEFVDPDTGAPDAALTAAVAQAALAEGVIVLTCGTQGNVIRFLPPLSIPDDLLHEGLDVVASALASR